MKGDRVPVVNVEKRIPPPFQSTKALDHNYIPITMQDYEQQNINSVSHPKYSEVFIEFNNLRMHIARRCYYMGSGMWKVVDICPQEKHKLLFEISSQALADYFSLELLEAANHQDRNLHGDCEVWLECDLDTPGYSWDIARVECSKAEFNPQKVLIAFCTAMRVVEGMRFQEEIPKN